MVFGTIDGGSIPSRRTKEWNYFKDAKKISNVRIAAIKPKAQDTQTIARNVYLANMSM